MILVSETWTGGAQTPTEEGPHAIVYRWHASSTACPECRSLDGTLDGQLRFTHHNCNCYQWPVLNVPGSYTFLGRSFIGTVVTHQTEEVGAVPGPGEQSFSASFDGGGSVSYGSGGFSFTASASTTQTLQNPSDQDRPAYAVYRTTETEYCDRWRIRPGVEVLHQAVFHTLVHFLTFTTNPEQYD